VAVSIAFELVPEKVVGQFTIRLDRGQIDRLAVDINETSAGRIDSIAILYNFWNDEFEPVEGYNHMTATGRLSMHVIKVVYSKVLSSIDQHCRSTSDCE